MAPLCLDCRHPVRFEFYGRCSSAGTQGSRAPRCNCDHRFWKED